MDSVIFADSGLLQIPYVAVKCWFSCVSLALFYKVMGYHSLQGCVHVCRYKIFLLAFILDYAFHPPQLSKFNM